MRGQENIVAMRQKGVRPGGHVSLIDASANPKFLQWQYEEDAKYPTVYTDGVPVESMDLRFLVGLSVHIRGDSIGRVKQIAAKARAAGAEHVSCFAGDKAAMWTKGDTTWRTF